MYRNISRIFVILLACGWSIQGYIYECLDGCQCDTDDEAIHCHNGQRKTLTLPDNRLRGFTVIGLTNNAIERLPSEAALLEKFPDLRAIDVEGNADFDCDSLKDYKTIKVYSNCGGGDAPTIIHGRLPDIEEATDECNFECQIKKHYRVLHEYLLRIWQMLKEKYEKMDKDTIVRDVQEFFTKLAAKVNRNLNDIQLRIKNGVQPTTAAIEDRTPTRLVVTAESRRRK